MRDSTWIEIDAAALVGNLRAIERVAGAPALAIVKANAYGHGMAAVSRILRAAGVFMLGVGTPNEALELRAGGDRGRLLVTGYSRPAAMPDLVRAGVEFSFWSAAQLADASRAAAEAQTPARLHLYVDAGMGRFGCAPAEAADLIRAALASPAVELAGVMSHLPSADEDAAVTARQVQAFGALRTAALEAAPGVLFHLASSAGIDRFASSSFDLVRAGLVLYGGPAGHRLAGQVRPVLSWQARIEDVRLHAAGDAIGYGGEYVCPQETLVGVLGAGYTDGFRRIPKNVNQVLLPGGALAPVLGRVCTQHCMIALPRACGWKPGDAVTLLGVDGGQSITATDLAVRWGTNEWDVLANLSPSIPRLYREGANP